jgi:hypothetical protein
MWKALIAGATVLMIAGSTLASAQQSSPAERPHRAQLTADDIAWSWPAAACVQTNLIAN